MCTKNVELAKECMRLSESCLYTSTSFFIWLRCLRWFRIIFISVPLVLGSLSSWELLTKSQSEQARLFGAVAAFIAGLLPTIYAALKFDDRLVEFARLAGEFKNLQDGFRRTALVSSLKQFSAFEQDVRTLMKRLERARSMSLTPPEWCFRHAQTKVKSGDYSFDVDEQLIAKMENRMGDAQSSGE